MRSQRSRGRSSKVVHITGVQPRKFWPAGISPSSERGSWWPGALYQIVSNLVLNAMQHAFAAGAAGTIRIEIGAAAGQIRLSVGDDGRGMDEAERLRVFEPFFTTRRGEGGSGLGLHIVYNLVTQVLHGHISCSSAPGQGTRFDIVWEPG